MRKGSLIVALRRVLCVGFVLSMVFGCPTKDSGGQSFTYKQIDALKVPDSFDYRTTGLIAISGDLGSSFGNITVRLLGTLDSEEPAVAHGNDTEVAVVSTDGSGRFAVDASVPLEYTNIVMKADYIGLPSAVYSPVKDRTASFNLVRSSTSSRAMTLDEPGAADPISFPPIRDVELSTKEGLDYIDQFDPRGKPLSCVETILDSQFLMDINASLPETRQVPTYNPSYLEADATIQIVDKEADAWVTFVHEGAGYRNALGFYTYDTASGPPPRAEDLEVRIIFPNASMTGSGGDLDSGDTIYIGRFPAGISIGWVLYADGWDGTRGYVRGNKGIYYSDDQYNPEGLISDKRHTVVLYDDQRQVLVTGIEDLKRPTGDNDFNDLVFFALVNPVESIGNLDNFTDIKRSVDTDKDGVIDSEDYFPDDPRYTTFENHTGTLVYEDMWPKLGDYDFNDLVVRYDYGMYGNSENAIPWMDMEFTVIASGAGYQNGLAVKLPVDASDLTLTAVHAPIGGGLSVESHKTGVNLVVFNNARQVVGAKDMFNTAAGEERVPTRKVSYALEFSSPVARAALGAVPFDVFLLSNNSNPDDQHHEVHLPDLPPSPLMQDGLIGTRDDSSDPGTSRYYKTKNNLPWALHVPGIWNYPIERVSIVDAYHRFGDWAESGGSMYLNWYSDADSMDKDRVFQ